MFSSSWLYFFMLSIVGRVQSPLWHRHESLLETWVYVWNKDFFCWEKLPSIMIQSGSPDLWKLQTDVFLFLIPLFWHPPILFWKFAEPPVKPLYTATFKLFKKPVPTLLTLFWNPHYWTRIVIREGKRQLNFQSVEDSKKVMLSPFYWISLATSSPIFIENPTQMLI